jgi:hypothetical protein
LTNTATRRNEKRPVMNSFDAAIAIGLVVAVITGFNAGLLRSGVTILPI